MSWAAHEFENYWLQKHAGLKASFLAIMLGTAIPDLFTKSLVYASDDPAAFHRGWPGVGFTHSLLFGVAFAVMVLAVTRSRSWALGILIGQWAHVFTDFADTAGVMPFFPFSTEPVTISMWKHAAAEGRYGDAAAYYSSLGGVWDLFWFVVVVVFCSQTLRRSYFRNVIVPADPRVWGWMHRTLRLPEQALLLIYRGLLFYGLARMIAWFLYARFDAKVPFQPTWGGPAYVQGNDLSDAGALEVLVRTAIGGVLFAAFLWLCWRLFIHRLWSRGYYPPMAAATGRLPAVTRA
jgi:LexA-binding, inner membrane-associated putative hydrolase